MKTKICSKCKEEKELSEFSKDKSRKDGLYCYCKKCKSGYKTNKETLNLWYQKNKESNKEKRKIYYQANRHYLREVNRKYRDANRELILSQKKSYYKKTKTKYQFGTHNIGYCIENGIYNTVNYTGKQTDIAYKMRSVYGVIN